MRTAVALLVLAAAACWLCRPECATQADALAATAAGVLSPAERMRLRMRLIAMSGGHG